jgi:hypothetical protein
MQPSGKRWHTREDSGLRLDRQLRWWHDDEIIDHPKIIDAFNAGLAPTDDGKFILRFGNDWCFVQVEDAAYEVRSVVFTPEPQLLLSDRNSEPLAVDTLRLEDDGVFSCRVKANRAKARFSRQAQADLGERLEEHGGAIRLRVGERTLPLAIS